MKKLYIKILIALWISLTAPEIKAQELSVFLKEAADRLIGSEEKINLLIEGDPDQVREQVLLIGGQYKYSVGRYSSVAIAADKVGELVVGSARNAAIGRIEYYPFSGQVFSDSLLLNNRVDSVHEGIGLSSAYTGKGVIVGIIDTGVDFSHPDLQDSSGKTRIKYIWDQGKPNSFRTPQPYNYGQEWNAFEIDNGLSNHDDPAGYYGHGTSVTGAAAGNGNAVGKYKGIAPDADIIAVATNFSNNGWLATVADAVHYIFSKADSLNQPCVINASIGSFGGANDGQDFVAKLIDGMLEEKRGRAFVCAAGNYGHLSMHLGYDITEDPKFTWFRPQSNAVQFILWADTADFNQAEYAFGADATTDSFRLRAFTEFRNIKENIGLRRDSLFSFSGNFLGIIETAVELVDFRYMMRLRILNIDSTNYFFRFTTRGKGRFDLWATSVWGFSDMVKNNLPDASVFPDIENYVEPDNLQTIANSFQCSPHTITVANYNNAKGYKNFFGDFLEYPSVIPLDIAWNSSRGPTRNGLLKPDLAATGDIVIAAGRLATIQTMFQNNQQNLVAEGGMHTVAGGTSTASPVIAGIIALYLEKCPNASHLEIKDALLAAAYSDNFTGNLPNVTWGYGKASAIELIRNLKLSVNLNTDKNIQSLCMGDEMKLSTTVNFFRYEWNNGETSSTITVADPGLFSVKVEDIKGCKEESETIKIGFSERPIKPFIWRDENKLFTIPADSYVWFFNGREIENSNQFFIEVKEDGDYHVQIFSTNKCSETSDVFPAVKFTGEEWSVNYLPNPSAGLIKVEVENNFSPSTTIVVYDALGNNIYSKTILNSSYRFAEYIDLTEFNNGLYFVQVENEKNISRGKIVKNTQ
jgi:subtilisin family serine protease